MRFGPTRCSAYTRDLLTQVKAGDLTIRGVSLGGIYTSLFVPELHLVLDAGIPARSFAGARTLLLSHGHADHLGSLPALLGIRGLVGKSTPLKVLMPAEIVDPVMTFLEAAETMQRFDLAIEPVGLRPGDECELGGDLRIRAIKTFHPVPSLGFLVIRRVAKLRPEFHGLPGPEIARRRRAGEDMVTYVERVELAYATDTLVQVLDQHPELYRARVLVLECTFLDARKPVATARAGCHIHLDELLERADLFDNQHLVLMHFSQVYKPAEIAGILDQRVPRPLRDSIIPFVPNAKVWPG